jgi:ABC-2 type transport system permease protein
VGLSVNGISKKFGHFQAVKDLSMKVKEGSIFGFLGANGAGKTTTMRMILDIFRPDTGSAALGALVKRQDEVQNGTAPINMLFMVGYLSSFIGGGTALSGNTSATWFKVMSLIPFWTPTVMLMRVGVGDAAPWEIALSIVLLIATILICAWGSARIYRFGVLMYGQKPSLGQIVQILKAK